LTLRIGPADPPAAADLDAMRHAAEEAVGMALRDNPREIVAVGGTASNLLKVTTGGSADRRVDHARLAEALATLGERPAAATAERFGINPTRARILPAGALLVDAVLRHYGLDALTVSEDGMREGAIQVAHHAGSAWRDQLASLTHGWRD
jgi:exopolyphosphatase/pppGpp-phosphohydrolase